MLGLCRYMLVNIEGRRAGEPIAVHELLNEYHGELVSPTHMLVLGSYPAIHHFKLEHHDKCLLLPSQGSGKLLHTHAKERQKGHFLVHLERLGLEQHWTSTHLSDKATEMFGCKFELPY